MEYDEKKGNPHGKGMAVTIMMGMPVSKKGMKAGKSRREAVKKAKAKSEQDSFQPHKMIDPKSGKSVKVNTYEEHLRLKKKGYEHDDEPLEFNQKAGVTDEL
tara:strand:- start:377 stop:682 length:306 start_codon:yes stop_codon:yes gene_type:complete